MSDKTATNREALLKQVNLVRPALATQAYIPALTHICFDGSYATAYNDIAAIRVKAEVDFEGCLPGELLVRALNSFGSENLLFQPSKDQAIVISSGRSKLKLPILVTKEFPFNIPGEKGAPMIGLDHSIMKGIERCLVSVGNDPTHPAQMGVTLDMNSDGDAVLYSTDNFTVSRYQTKTEINLPGDMPVILPTFFCQQLVALSKAFPSEEIDLYLVPGALVVKFGKAARLFNKTLVDLEPLDFPRIFEKYCKLSSLKDRLSAIPDNWDSAFNRAMLVLSGEVDKATRVTVSGETIKLYSTSSMGDADDSMSYDHGDSNAPPDPFYIDPSLVLRASKVCGKLVWNPKTVALADDDAQFVHLISYCSK